MTRLLLSLLACSALTGFAQDPKAPANRAPADGPFIPASALPGGKVIPLYPANSPFLKQDRVHEAERYNTAGKATDKLLNTLNIHNPTIEVHLPPADAPKTGTAVIIAPGGGHKILWVGPEATISSRFSPSKAWPRSFCAIVCGWMVMNRLSMR